MKLDLGCGQHGPIEGFEGVDKIGPADWVVDLDWGSWPWKDSSVDEIRCSHLVEHVRDLCGFMREMHRIMKPGGRAEIQHPYQFHVRAWQDPTHVRALNEISWFYFDKDWRNPGPYSTSSEFGDTDFVIVELDAIPDPAFQDLSDNHPEEFEKAARQLINVIADIRVVLECRK